MRDTERQQKGESSKMPTIICAAFRRNSTRPVSVAMSFCNSAVGSYLHWQNNNHYAGFHLKHNNVNIDTHHTYMVLERELETKHVIATRTLRDEYRTCGSASRVHLTSQQNWQYGMSPETMCCGTPETALFPQNLRWYKHQGMEISAEHRQTEAKLLTSKFSKRHCRRSKPKKGQRTKSHKSINAFCAYDTSFLLSWCAGDFKFVHFFRSEQNASTDPSRWCGKNGAENIWRSVNLVVWCRFVSGCFLCSFWELQFCGRFY